ncbi:class A beta-lactamase [Brevundimonas sp.]|uniref:class A beta-lactamase n=1 Tax=Brevundimonas sp. TaxID=1871086 RepID=UPI0028A21427|nr:class A beta-lactamase [Brevundimonas sp.]
MRADRRTVLLGAGALGLTAGCADEVPSKVDQALDLSGLEARHGGRLGFVLQGSHGRLLWRADERFTYCSTFKLFLAAATLQRVSRGEERLDRAVPITAADMISHAPVTEPAVGSSLTIEKLCEAAVTVSDNPAANILIREMGGLDAWRMWYRTIGDQITRVDRWEPQLNIVGDDLDTTTPAQTAHNLAWLQPEVFKPATSAPHMIMWAGSPAGAGRIRAALDPQGWALLHKTGTGGSGPTNDIGYLVPKRDGKAAAPSAVHAAMPIAVYYEATSASTPEQRDAVIADATRLALKALGHG